MKAPWAIRAVLLRMLQTAGARCPKCGEEIALPGPARRLELERVVNCVGCGRFASVSELASATGTESAAAVIRDLPPKDTKIVKRELKGGGCAWEVPASGRGGGLLVFGALWLTISLLVTGGFVFAGSHEGWPAILFGLLFVAIGVGLFYGGLRSKYAVHLIIVDEKSVVLARSLFGRKKMKSLPRGSIASVEKKVFYQQNYQPVYGIEIRGSRGKLRFGSMLEEDEKAWFVTELRKAIRPEKSIPEFRATTHRQERFTMAVPKENTKSMLVTTLIFLFVSGAFVAVGFLFLDEAGFFQYLWIGATSLFVLGGLAALVVTIRKAGESGEVVALSKEVLVRRKRGPKVLEERSLPRGELVAVRCYGAGQRNGQMAHVVELVGRDRAVPIAYSSYTKELPAFAEELAAKLGVGEC